MATDSSPGSNLDIPSVEGASPVSRPAQTPAQKPTSNGFNINTGDKPAGPAAKPADAPPAGKAPAGKTPAGKTPAGKPVASKSPAKKESDKATLNKGKDAVAQDDGQDKAPAAKQARQPKQKSTKPAKTRSSTREELEEIEKAGALGMMTLLPAWMISAIVHMVILLIFGLMLMPEKKADELRALVANVGEPSEGVDEVADISPEELDTDVTELTTTDVTSTTTEPITPTEISDSPAPTEVAMTDVGIPTAPAGELLKELTVGTGGAGKGSLGGRAGNAQSKKASGATDESEAAVFRALKWLAEHQQPDGSWSFDHTHGQCQGQCGDPGKLEKARFAATGLALLPFLGAGQTHKQGKFKEQVMAGLLWLGVNMKLSVNGGDMTAGGGSMYGHGIATMALCEAYAMTQDRRLAAHAQAALNFIIYAQDPVGGGWRYSPRQPGDTSAVGWQIMALKSGYLGFLEVGKPTINGATKFLDSAQAEGGAYYGYTGPGKGAATTAVGLLCRMYLGWDKDKPELEKGVQHLARLGPNTGNMYFSYYATQVLHQYDGPDGDLWNAWNTKMRDSLVASQSLKKHETGSWLFKGNDHGYDAGGRLYATAMAAMTLEIYYRYMPIYSQKSAEDDFMD